MQNPRFDILSWGPGTMPDGWTVSTGTYGSEVDINETTFRSGTRSVVFNNGTGEIRSNLFDVSGSDLLAVDFEYSTSAGATFSLDVNIREYTDRDTFDSATAVVSGLTTATTGWSRRRSTPHEITSPSTIRYAQVEFEITGLGAAEYFYLDSVDVQLVPPRARAYRGTSDQTGVTKASEQQIQLNTESYDYGGNYTHGSGYVFTAPEDGPYNIAGCVRAEQVAPGATYFYASALITYAAGGSLRVKGAYSYSALADIGGSVDCGNVYLSKGDTVGLYFYNNANNFDVKLGEGETYMTCARVTEEI